MDFHKLALRKSGISQNTKQCIVLYFSHINTFYGSRTGNIDCCKKCNLPKYPAYKHDKMLNKKVKKRNFECRGFRNQIMPFSRRILISSALFFASHRSLICLRVFSTVDTLVFLASAICCCVSPEDKRITNSCWFGVR